MDNAQAPYKPKVVLAGASGFVGRALCDALAHDHDVVALSRRPMPMADHGRVQWRQANLFNMRHTEEALRGAEVGLYLVHSMLPSARLSQGSFVDLDLICADNFARAAKRAGVKRIIYLSGLIPHERPLSTHLASRLEVEQALADHGLPVTTLRAGLIIGAGGSSCSMMLRLVERLPIMVLPGWTASKCQPIALEDVLRMLILCVDDPSTQNQTWDIGGPDVLTYQHMLAACADVLGRKRLWFKVPVQLPGLSLAWVSVIASSPVELVRPLVTSLRHDMLVLDPSTRADFSPSTCLPFVEALKKAIAPAPARAKSEGAPRLTTPSAAAATGHAQRARGVVSVQRLPLPKGKDARWVAKLYGEWLPQAMWRSLGFFLRVRTWEQGDGRPQRVHFNVRGLGWTLLQLDMSHERSDADRQLFYITGGMLARPTESLEPGRFEFRTVLARSHVLAAIHDFVPRMPWVMYKYSQALVHALVMRGFAAALRKQR